MGLGRGQECPRRRPQTSENRGETRSSEPERSHIPHRCENAITIETGSMPRPYTLPATRIASRSSLLRPPSPRLKPRAWLAKVRPT